MLVSLPFQGQRLWRALSRADTVGGTRASSLLLKQLSAFPERTRVWGGWKKSCTNPGFPDQVCFLLQLGCYCLHFHKYSGQGWAWHGRGDPPTHKKCGFFLSKTQKAVLECQALRKPRKAAPQPGPSRTQREEASY